MRRPLAGVLTLLGPILSACSPFESTPAADAVRAPASDGGTPETDAGALTFCQKNTGAIFCDDFEGPGRVVSVPAPWDAFGGSKVSTNFSVAEGFESAAGLRVVGRFQPLDGPFLQKALSVPSRGVRWTFRLRVSKLTEYSANTQAQVGVAGFDFADGKQVKYILVGEGNGDLTGFVFTDLVPGTTFKGFDKPPIGLQAKAWMDVRIELEPHGADNVFRFFLGTVMLSEVTYPAAPSTTLALGAKAYAGGADTELTFDDVLVTAL